VPATEKGKKSMTNLSKGTGIFYVDEKKEKK